MIDYIFGKYDKERISIRELSDQLNDRGYRTILGNKWNILLCTGSWRILSMPASSPIIRNLRRYPRAIYIFQAA